MKKIGQVSVLVFLLILLTTLSSWSQTTYSQIKNKDYSQEYLPIMRTEIIRRAQNDFGINGESFTEIITNEVVEDAIFKFTPSEKNVGKITDSATESLRKKYSTENKLFDTNKLNALVALFIFIYCIGYYILKASRGEQLYIRKIAGIASIDEAVGRCTEMGKPVLYIPGIYDMDDIQTISSISILGHVAKTTAEYETPLLVPCTRSLVMSTAFEVCREAYIKAGKADHFVPENVRYLTDDQFGYVAGVDGIMLRDKPAANFYLGVFFAESLILAETGHSIGSIQIAGTAMVHQIPFFVASCDYTLIGEELFAASAYLSQDPMQLGSIKGQDMSKMIMLIIIVAGILISSVSSDGATFIHQILTAK